MNENPFGWIIRLPDGALLMHVLAGGYVRLELDGTVTPCDVNGEPVAAVH